MRRIATGLMVILLGSGGIARACEGDADADGQVGVWEVLRLVDCSLEPSAGCATVGVGDVVSAVRNALYGCTLRPRWVSYAPCVQCEPCLGLSINEQIALLNGLQNGQLTDVGVPEDVRVLDRHLDGAAVCLACGCPLWTVAVLVSDADAERLIALGWRD